MHNISTKNKGITLVALVVTVIILLILTGISIASLTGNGLFEKAKLAKEKQENAEINEKEKIDSMANEIDTVSGNREQIMIDKDTYEQLLRDVANLKAQNTNNNYSTDEQVVGNWIDGKTIYRRVIPFTTSNSYSKIGTLTNFKNIINAYAIGKDSNSNDHVFPNYTTGSYYSDFYINTAGEIYWYSTSSYSNLPATFIVEYTKTTD